MNPVEGEKRVGKCLFCGKKQTVPKLPDEHRANLYARAEHYRRNNDFDKAMEVYEKILEEDLSDPEAYWSLVLCKYGIEYVKDPQNDKHMPTVNRAQYTSIFADEDYKSAIENADESQRELYEAEAEEINRIQKGILEIANNEEPFDIFICYKETDENGKRTRDSILAQELYHELTRDGYKVFFARVTLDDKIGSAYEPYIFSALNSSKVMVVLGTRPEFFNAVWVKNEWSRFLSLIKSGKKKVLIPAYKGMDPYDLPAEFSHLQALDMDKLGFMADLVMGIEKMMAFYKRNEAKPVEASSQRVETPAPEKKKEDKPVKKEKVKPERKKRKKALPIIISLLLVAAIAVTGVIVLPDLLDSGDEETTTEVAESQTETATEAESNSLAVNGSDTETESATETDSDTDINTDTATDTDTETETDTQAIAGSDGTGSECDHENTVYVGREGQMSHWLECESCGEKLSSPTEHVKDEKTATIWIDGNHYDKCVDCGLNFESECYNTGKYEYSESKQMYVAVCGCGKTLEYISQYFLVKGDPSDYENKNMSISRHSEDGISFTRYTSNSASINYDTFFYAYHGGTVKTGKYAIMKYRFPEGGASKNGFVAHAGTVEGGNVKALGNGDATFDPVGTLVDDGEWHITVIDLSSTAAAIDGYYEGNAAKFIPDDNGDYYTAYLRFVVDEQEMDNGYMNYVDVEFVAFADRIEPICKYISTFEKSACVHDDPHDIVYDEELGGYTTKCAFCQEIMSESLPFNVVFDTTVMDDDFSNVNIVSSSDATDGVAHTHIYHDTSKSSDVEESYHTFINETNYSSLGRYLVLKVRSNQSQFQLWGTTAKAHLGTGTDSIVLRSEKYGWSEDDWRVIVFDMTHIEDYKATENGDFVPQCIRFDYFDYRSPADDSFIDIAYIGVCEDLDIVKSYVDSCGDTDIAYYDINTTAD